MKKIMFSDEYNLTEAVLNGTKTMTRRLMRLGEDDAKIYDSLAPDTRKQMDEYVIARYSPYQVGDEVAIAMCYLHVQENYRRNPASLTSSNRRDSHGKTFTALRAVGIRCLSVPTSCPAASASLTLGLSVCMTSAPMIASGRESGMMVTAPTTFQA